MPSINMIAPRRAEKRRVERDVRRLVVLICIELVAGVTVSGILWGRIYATRARIADVDVQLIRLQPKVKRIHELEAETKALEPKLDLLENAKEQTLRWYNLMDRLSTSLPERTWLRRMDSADPAPGKNDSQIVFNGVAETQRLVGELMMRMYSNPDLTDISLRFTQATDVAKRQVYEFELAANLKTSNAQQKGVTPNAAQKS